jgi:RNA polymerase sigma-70 factor, ECF subfamily
LLVPPGRPARGGRGRRWAGRVSGAGAITTFRRDQPGDSFRGWLYTITLNKLRDFGRRAARQPAGPGGSDALERLLQHPNGDVSSDDSEVQEDHLLVYRRAVDLVLGEFEETTRRAFLQVVVDEQAPADVARELGTTANAVYLAKSRVMRRLREELEGLF